MPLEQRPLPPGSDTLAAWARARGYTFHPTPAATWYRAWEPLETLVSPQCYFGALQMPMGPAQVVLAEPWCAVGDEEPLGRGVWAFITHPALRYRAAARVGANHMTRVSYIGVPRPLQQHTGDPAWDDVAVTFAATQLDAARALTPSLRKLLLGWSFEGHIEVKPGGMLFHLARVLPTPEGYEHLLAWAPMLIDKALKQPAGA